MLVARYPTVNKEEHEKQQQAITHCVACNKSVRCERKNKLLICSMNIVHLLLNEKTASFKRIIFQLIFSLIFFYLQVAHCKERWRNLRACLTRHIKQQQQAALDGTTNHKPYYLADHMDFLLPYTKSRSGKEQMKYETPTAESGKLVKIEPQTPKINTTHSNATTTYTISHGEGDDNQYVTLVQSSTGELASADELNEALQVNAAAEAHQQKSEIIEQAFSSSNNYVPAKEHLQEIIYEQVPPKRIKMATPDTDDADLEFFRSLLPDMRSMTPSQKRRFKMSIFGLIENVLNNTDTNTQI